MPLFCLKKEYIMITKIFVYFKRNMYFIKYINYLYEYIGKYKVIGTKYAFW